MAAKQYPLVARVNQCLRYKNGKLFWRKGTNLAGKEAGSDRGRNRYQVYLDGHFLQRSHVVWVICTGNWPTKEVDHRNRNSGDDRFKNLRLATHSQNGANRRRSKHNTSGVKGVCWHKRKNKWHAQIRVNTKRLHLGYFTSLSVAQQAYISATKRYFGVFAYAG